MENEIEVNGFKYVLKSSIKTTELAKKNTKGMNYCLVRSRYAGVFAGYVMKKGVETIVYNARRIWSWDGAASLSQLSIDGTSKPNTCKFPIEVSEVFLTDVIEILPCTEKAKLSIASVKIWQQ